ncbi:hypothetical protein MKS88_000595 [Plasmodium brasilianum]|uniref:Uncharacterized protein n=1 Tax=Plasmodium brasilianum TaxID=5824 RepID=A0ACB9YGQ2_PLABR|nr:hypothetical protein MKS88_000595 [Plasmodium brasilianum]
MEIESKLLLFIKIATFIFVVWMCYFYEDMSNYSKYLCKKHYTSEKLGKRTYRLLRKRRTQENSNKVWIVKNSPFVGEYEKLCMSNNVKVTKVKSKKSTKCSLNNLGGNERIRKSKYFNNHQGKSYSAKRSLDKLYYRKKLRESIKSDFKFLRNCAKEKVGLICTLLSFLTVIGILLIFLIPLYKKGGKLYISKYANYGASIGFSILTFIVILVIIYSFSLIEKYLWEIYRKLELHNTAYPYFHKVFYYR